MRATKVLLAANRVCLWRSRWQSVLLLLAVGAAFPAAAQQQELGSFAGWRFTGLTGIGVREIDADAHPALLTGFSASRLRGERVEFAVEGFMLLPTTEIVGPRAIVRDGLEGVSEITTEDLDVLGLFRVNFWLAERSVRPYLSIGAGLHVKDRSRVIVDAVPEPPNGNLDVSSRDLSETVIGVASLIAFGAEIPVAGTWRLRAEGRAPIVPLVFLAPSTHTFGFAVGVSYVHR